MKTPKKLDVYCIGLGKAQFENHLSKTLIELKDLINIKKLCDVRPDRCDMFKETFQEAGFVLPKDVIETSSANLFKGLSTKSDNERVFVISTPMKSHFELVEKSLQAFGHVYVDKPFVKNHTKAKQLVDLASKSEKIIVVGAQRKFETIYQSILSVVKKIGTIKKIHLHNNGNFPNADPKFRENNIIPVGMGYHAVDMVVWLIQQSTGDKDLHDFQVQNASLQRWESYKDHYVAFDSFSLYRKGEVNFPVIMSCSHLAPMNSVDELLIITGTNGEVQFRRQNAPRSMAPGKADFIYWDSKEGIVVKEKLDTPNDKADRGAPLKQLITNIHAGTPEEIKSTGKEALPVMRILDEIVVKGIELDKA